MRAALGFKYDACVPFLSAQILYLLSRCTPCPSFQQNSYTQYSPVLNGLMTSLPCPSSRSSLPHALLSPLLVSFPSPLQPHIRTACVRGSSACYEPSPPTFGRR